MMIWTSHFFHSSSAFFPSSSSSSSSFLDLAGFMGVAAFTERILYAKLSPPSTPKLTMASGCTNASLLPIESSVDGIGNGGGGGAAGKAPVSKSNPGESPKKSPPGASNVDPGASTAASANHAASSSVAISSSTAMTTTTTTLETLRSFNSKEEEMKEFVECVDFWSLERKLRGIRIKSGIRGIFKQLSWFTGCRLFLAKFLSSTQALGLVWRGKRNQLLWKESIQREKIEIKKVLGVNIFILILMNEKNRWWCCLNLMSQNIFGHTYDELTVLFFSSFALPCSRKSCGQLD